MIAMFTCQKCNNRIGFKDGKKAMVICQKCGGYDFKINNSISIYPVLHDEEIGPRKEYKTNDLISGKHEQGFVWLIEVNRSYKPKSEEDKPELDPKIEVKIEEIAKEEEENIESELEKPSVAKTVRKLRLKMG